LTEIQFLDQAWRLLRNYSLLKRNTLTRTEFQSIRFESEQRVERVLTVIENETVGCLVAVRIAENDTLRTATMSRTADCPTRVRAMVQVTTVEAAVRLPELLDRAANGDDVEIQAENGQTFRLIPARSRPPVTGVPRAGSCQGLIELPNGWEEPLDPSAGRTHFALPTEQWPAFCEALDLPPRVIPALQRLFADKGVFDGDPAHENAGK